MALAVALAVYSQLPITAKPTKRVETVSIGKVQGDPDKALHGMKDGKLIYATPNPLF